MAFITVEGGMANNLPDDTIHNDQETRYAL